MKATALGLLYLLFLLVVGPGSHVTAKRYLRCELARKLLNQHSFERSLLSNWICLLEHESELDTAKVSTNPNGSQSYGLFQINGRYCQEGRRGGICNIKCDELLNENLNEAAICAKRIQTTDGFRHWNGWERHCRNTQNLPNLKVICGI